MLRPISFCCAGALLGTIVLSAATAAGAEPAATAGQPSLYQKESTWPQTMLVCRKRLAAHLEELQLARANVKLGPWYATQPLPVKTFAEALGAETQTELDVKNSEGKPIWHKHEEWTDGSIHNLHHAGNTSTYLLRTITADKAVSFASGFGSNDGLEIWLNGHKLLSKDIGRTAEPD